MTNPIFEQFSPGAFAGLFAAAPPPPAPVTFGLDKVNFNWFDVVVAILLIVGYFQGKKRGMSVELLDLLQWLLIVVVSALFYDPLAKLCMPFANLGYMIWAVISYIVIAVVIKIIFSAVKRGVGEKLIGSDIFGRMEYYFGMVAGMLRYFCMIMVAMAILHAKEIDPAKIEAYRKLQAKELGSQYFPSLDEIRQAILYKSLVGTTIRKHMSDQLIKASSGDSLSGPVDRESGPGRKKERALDELMGNSPPKEAPKKQ